MTKRMNIALMGLFLALVIVGGFIRIPIPFIPFTMQLFFVTLTGIILGPKKGALTMLSYAVLGLIGLPIFSKGGGFGYIFQPSFGYIIGFIAAAYIAGMYVHVWRKKRDFKVMLIASFIALAITYIFGLIYFYIIMNVYMGAEKSISWILYYGFVTTVVGDFILCFATAEISKRVLKAMDAQNIG